MNRLRAKKGFTLIEVVIAMAVTVILLAAVMSLFSVTNGMINSMKTDTDLKTVEAIYTNYIETRVKPSTDVVVLTDVLASYDTSTGECKLTDMNFVSYAENYRDSKNNPTSGVTARALIIYFDPSDGIYHLSEIDVNGTTSAECSDSFEELDVAQHKYQVFNDEFYGNWSLGINPTNTVAKHNQAIQTDSTRAYIKLALIPTKSDGTALKEENLMFELVNYCPSGDPAQGRGNVEFVPDCDNLGGDAKESATVILYTSKTY